MSSSARTVQLSERDLHLLRWIGRAGLCTTQQVAARWFTTPDHPEGSQSRANQRIMQLEQAGLLRRERMLATRPVRIRLDGPPLVYLTRVGQAAVGLKLPVARVVPSQVAHTLALVDLLTELQREYPDATIVTERELRAQREGVRSEYALPYDIKRTPDALLILPEGNTVLRRGRIVAIELDLTQKPVSIYQRLVVGYREEPVDMVWWYCIPTAARQLREIVERRRMTLMIEVREREL